MHKRVDFMELLKEKPWEIAEFLKRVFYWFGKVRGIRQGQRLVRAGVGLALTLPMGVERLWRIT